MSVALLSSSMKYQKSVWLFGKVSVAKITSYFIMCYPFAVPLTLTAFWGYPLYAGFYANLFINISIHILCCVFAVALVTFPLSYFKNRWRQNIMMWFLVVPLQLSGPLLFFLLFNDQINSLSQPKEPADFLIILGASSYIYAVIIFFIQHTKTRSNSWRNAVFLWWTYADPISTRSMSRIYDAGVV